MILKALITFTLALTGAANCSGLDDMFLLDVNSAPFSKNAFSLEPGNVCSRGYGFMLMHTNPYQNAALNWDLFAARYGFDEIGLAAYFRSYRLENLYNNSLFAFGPAFSVGRGIFARGTLSYEREEFKTVGNYSRIDLAGIISVHKGGLTGQARLEGLNLKKQYAHANTNNPRQLIDISYFVNDKLRLSAGISRDSQKRTRWCFEQELALTGNFSLQLGYINNPNTLQWGLDFSYGSFRFLLNYIATNKLNDTIILGISAVR
jgi:hypothetical protein